MGRNRKRDKEWQNTLKDISESGRANVEHNRQISEKLDDLNETSRATAESTAQTNEQLKAIKSDTEKSSKSKIPLYGLIMTVITLVVTISGYSVKSIIDEKNLDSGTEPTAETVAELKTEVAAEVAPEMEVEAETEPETETKAETEREIAAEESEYTIYLYSEHRTIDIGTNVEMTATLNFKTDAVTITAYFESGGEESLSLYEKNATEWQNDVYFDKLGVHKIVVTATAPNGEVIENSIEVEVIPLSIDIDIDTINQFLPTGLQGVN